MFRVLLLLAALAAVFYWILPAIEHQPTPIEQKVEQQIRDLNNEVNTLQRKSQAAGKKTRQQLDDQAAALHHKIQQSEKKLGELRASSQGRWASAKELWARWFGPKKPE
jgi:hypothetical protein